MPVIQEKQPKTDEAVNSFENSYDVPDIEEKKIIETSVQSRNGSARETELNKPPKTTTKTPDLIADFDVIKR